MITADQIILHALGDYVIQSDWMANEKTKRWLPAVLHALTYTIPFLFLTQNPVALAIIGGTHFIIDHWRLARYVVWAKNYLFSPGTMKDGHPEWRHPWSDCVGTGFHKDRPAWLAVWLMIFVDNTMHIIINGVTLHYIG